MTASGTALAYEPLAEVARALASRRMSASELLEATLARVAAMNPHLNAFVSLEADAAREAARASDGRLAAGRPRGALEGVPLAVKDLFWRKGRPLTAGARRPVLDAAPENATVIDRLEAAGAVLLGGLGLHELAYGVTSVNPHHGAIRNPWALDRNPGGSSGGSAAALAAGLAYGSLGTDTGGSIRIPAALCGVVGLKPTYGRVSRHGVFPLAWSLDHVGPMARTAGDVALLLGVIAGPDPKDPTTSRRPVSDYAAVVERRRGAGLEGLRLGAPEGFFFERAEPEVARLVRGALEQAERLGARVQPVRLPRTEAAVPAALLVLLSEAAALHAKRLADHPESLGGDVRTRLEQGRLVAAADYVTAQRVRAVVRRELEAVLETVDCLATPTTPTTAGPIEEGAGSPADAARRAMTHLTRPFNLTGLPALSLPCGFTAVGLPVGLQLVGRPFDEATLLGVAGSLEAALGLAGRRPPL